MTYVWCNRRLKVWSDVGRSKTPVLAGEVKWAHGVQAPRLINDLRRKVGWANADPGTVTVVAADIFAATS